MSQVVLGRAQGLSFIDHKEVGHKAFYLKTPTVLPFCAVRLSSEGSMLIKMSSVQGNMGEIQSQPYIFDLQSDQDSDEDSTVQQKLVISRHFKKVSVVSIFCLSCLLAS